MKPAFISIFLILVLGSQIYAQTYSDSMSTQEKKDWISSNLGADIIGDAFSYNPATGALEISGSTRATIPNNFKGTVEVKDGGTATVKENFQGSININNGNIELSGKGTFKGTGKYSIFESFTINQGEILLPNSARVAVSNANTVTFENNKVSGRAGKNAAVNNQLFGENTWFTIDTNGKLKIHLIGEPSKTTLPNGDIRKIGSKYHIGSMELDADSFIYLRAGDRMKFEGKTLLAKDKDLLIQFERQGKFIRPFISSYQYKEPNVQIRAADLSREAVAAGRWVDKNAKPTQKNLDKTINDNELGQVTIAELIEHVSSNNGVDAPTAKAFISVESNGRANVVNYKGRPSYGLGQMTDIAVEELNNQRAKKGLSAYDKIEVRNNPSTNARASIEYYALMAHRFYGNEEAAIVAYNYGEGKAGEFYTKRANDNTDRPLKDVAALKDLKKLPTGVKLHIAKFREFKKRYAAT